MILVPGVLVVAGFVILAICFFAAKEADKSLANAEIIRAEGIAKANKIIGDSLQNNDAYIHYLWVEALRETKNAVVYVPTEAGIPITEATRFADKP